MAFQPGSATILLVHGAWTDGSIWKDIVVPLESAGLNVIAAPIGLTTLSEDIASVTRVVERTSGPVLLGAHAYAGGVIGGIVDERVVGYAFVAGLAPDEGQTIADVFYRDQPQAPKLEPDRHGYIWLPDSAFPTAFAQNADADRISQLRATQRPISVSAITEKCPAPGWKSRPSRYLVAESDRMIPAVTQTFMAERMAATIERHDVDHTPMVTSPEAVVRFLLNAAEQIFP